MLTHLCCFYLQYFFIRYLTRFTHDYAYYVYCAVNKMLKPVAVRRKSFLLDNIECEIVPACNCCDCFVRNSLCDQVVKGATRSNMSKSLKVFLEMKNKRHVSFVGYRLWHLSTYWYRKKTILPTWQNNAVLDQTVVLTTAPTCFLCFSEKHQ